jgi:hypothetical protein
MVNVDARSSQAISELLPRLLRNLTRPRAETLELVRQILPEQFNRYLVENPAASPQVVVKALLTEAFAILGQESPLDAEILAFFWAGESVSNVARRSEEKWGWSQATFYTRYREARERFAQLLMNWETQLSRTVADEPIVPVPDENVLSVQPPFKGLHCFDVADAHLFYGREALISELVTHLTKQRFLAVVGASGSGKSSLVRAGLIPALQRTPTLTGEHEVAVYLITPTGDPLKALAVSLVADPHNIGAALTLRDGLAQDRFLPYQPRRQIDRTDQCTSVGDRSI